MRSKDALFGQLSRCVAVCTALLGASPAGAITIDQMTGRTATVVDPLHTAANHTVATAGAIGGTRSLSLQNVGVDTVTADVAKYSNVFMQQEGWGASAVSTLTYDGDLLPGLTNPAGLGGLSLVADRADSFLLVVEDYDWPFSMPVYFTLTVYDRSDPGGRRWSAGTITVNERIGYAGGPAKTFVLPFSAMTTAGPNGKADFTRVGAITLQVSSQTHSKDLVIRSLSTNGFCTHVPDGLKPIIDACGVCGGDGSSCAGCDGIPNSGKQFDACGVCGGNGSSCAGCDGVPNSGKRIDVCGVCGGNGSSCVGCDGIPNSGKQIDACGVCGGNGKGCIGCDGVLNSGKRFDACGVCGGNGSSCAGCDGVPNSGQVADACGVCGGDGSSCGNACTVQEIDVRVTKAVKQVLAAARQLKTRSHRFGKAAETCSGTKYSSVLTKVDEEFEKMKVLLEDEYLQVQKVCPDSICTTVSSTLVLRKLRNHATRLYRYQLSLKLSAIADCHTPDENYDPNAKVTIDYYNDLLEAIRRLPNATTRCTP